MNQGLQPLSTHLVDGLVRHLLLFLRKGEVGEGGGRQARTHGTRPVITWHDMNSGRLHSLEPGPSSPNIRTQGRQG